MCRVKHTRRLLYAVTFLTDCTFGLLIFSITRDLAERGAGLATLGIVGAVSSLGWAASSVVFGRLSDRIGRRGLMRCGIILLVVGCAGCALLHAHATARVGFYWFASLAGGMVYPPLIAWLCREQGQATIRRQASAPLIRFCLSWNLGLVSGLFFGGIAFGFDSRLPLVLGVVVSLVNLLVINRTDGSTAAVPVGEPAGDPEPTADRARAVLFTRISWLSNLAGAFALGLVLHLFSDLAVSLGIPSQNHGSMLALMRIVIIATYLLMHRAGFWHYRFASNVAVHAAGLCGLFLLTCANTQAGLMLGLCGLAVLQGFNYFASLYYSTTGSQDRKKGLAGGIHEAMLGLGIAMGALIGGLAGAALGPRAPYRFSMLIVVSIFLVQTWMVARSSRNTR